MKRIRFLIGDCETDGLNPTLVHCFTFKSYPEGEKFTFRQDECYSEELLELFARADYIVGHNFITYDYPKVMRKLLNVSFDDKKIIDTLVLSRMYRFDRPEGHGLESWGETLGVAKPEHTDWSHFTEDMLFRCSQDTEINWRLFDKFYREMGEDFITGLAVKIEQRAQYNMERMREYGFYFNLPVADAVFAEVAKKEEDLRELLQKDFPPKAVPRRKIKPVTTVTEAVIAHNVLGPDGKNLKEGKKNVKRYEVIKKMRDRIPGIDMTQVFGDFCAFVWEPFNPGSPDQILEKLNTCGWKPVTFNKPTEAMLAQGIRVGTPKVSDEDNLETIPADAPESIKNIGHYLVVRGRRNRMNEWFAALGDDQRVHGSIIGLGARTHRCAHRGPNLANVPAILNRKGEPAYMGKEYRGVWGVPNEKEINTIYKDHYKTLDERRLIGVDAKGIQLRVLCHYLNDPEYTKRVLNEDIHSYNMFAAGINPGTCEVNEKLAREKLGRVPSVEEAVTLRLGKDMGYEWSGRNIAKTFIYAYLLGAGNSKIEQITGIPGQELKDKFYQEIPALRHLQEVVIPANLRKGFFMGVDGRKFFLDNVPPHKVLSIYLQGGEATIMKLALNMMVTKIDKYDYDAFPVAFVHDEFQIDSALHCAESVKNLAISSIVGAGEYLQLKCPMASKGKIGLNWAETH